jgi:hypothetical protein
MVIVVIKIPLFERHFELFISINLRFVDISLVGDYFVINVMRLGRLIEI